MRKFIAATTLCLLGVGPIVASLNVSPTRSNPGTVADGGTQPFGHAVKIVADGGTQPFAHTVTFVADGGTQPFHS
jgi:hypothetical protein